MAHWQIYNLLFSNAKKTCTARAHSNLNLQRVFLAKIEWKYDEIVHECMVFRKLCFINDIDVIIDELGVWNRFV